MGVDLGDDSNDEQLNDQDNDQQEEVPQDVQEKVRKNLIWIFIFAVIMLFGGLTSGYIVNQGSNFWVHITMPQAFMLSTVVIILSSITLFIARKTIQQNKFGPTSALLGITLFLGLLFGYFQLSGWNYLINTGNALSSDIINAKGKYGNYFSLTYEQKEISYDNYEFFWQGEPISEEIHSEMKDLGRSFMSGARKPGFIYDLENYGTKFILHYQGAPLIYTNQTLQLDGEALAPEIHDRLWYFGENLVEERGDFVMKGKYGEDFTIWYKGKELEYVNRQFFLDDMPLSAKLSNDLYESRNTASSWIFVFVIVHLAHWLGGIISLLVMFIKGLRKRYSSADYLGIKVGSIYWHFLGILWIYLYAFLILIH